MATANTVHLIEDTFKQLSSPAEAYALVLNYQAATGPVATKHDAFDTGVNLLKIFDAFATLLKASPVIGEFASVASFASNVKKAKHAWERDSEIRPRSFGAWSAM
jgi:hypothetical protein